MIIMEISVINIGNSKGIRLSKMIIEKYKIKDKIDIILEEDSIILKPKSHPRMNWEESFIEMNKHGDDQLLIDDIFTDENIEEWK